MGSEHMIVDHTVQQHIRIFDYLRLHEKDTGFADRPPEIRRGID